MVRNVNEGLNEMANDVHLAKSISSFMMRLADFIANGWFATAKSPATANTGVKRISAIDTTRGILFVLMTSTHALTLANVADVSIFRSAYWLPGGWATTSFIMLSGYTIAFAYPWQNRDYRSIRKRLYRRAKEILLVMFFSNIVMLSMSYAMAGNLSVLAQSNWWVGLFTLQTEYSISAILLPTAVLLFIAADLALICEKIKIIPFAAIALVMVIMVTIISRDKLLPMSHLTDIMLYGGVGGFSIFPLLALGVFGLSLGFSTRVLMSTFSNTKVYAILCIMLILMILVEPLTGIKNMGVICISRFTLLFLAGACLSAVKAGHRALAFLPLIGKYALFSFIIHRIVLQGFHLLYKILLIALPVEILYPALAIPTLLTITIFCKMRSQVPALDAGLRKCYL
jgi:hypothetical protein